MTKREYHVEETYLLDCFSTKADGFEAGAAKSVDSEGWGLGWHATLQGDVTRQVCGIETGSDNVTEDGLIDMVRREVGVSKSSLGTQDSQVSGGDSLQLATEGTERGTLSTNNENSLLSNRHDSGIGKYNNWN